VGPDAYYMGIVDFQQQYNFEKQVTPSHSPSLLPSIFTTHFLSFPIVALQVERILKVYFKGEPPEGLSCMEPIGYRSRFLRRMEELLDLEDAS
jgi:hypothetical protein